MKRSHLSNAARLWLVVVWLLLAADVARAAELSWQAPAGCASREQVISQVEELLRKPLGEVQGLAFEVVVSAADAGRFVVRVRTVLDGAARGEREIAGGSCREVADAAAVAIAMAVSETEGDQAEWQLPPVRPQTDAAAVAEPGAAAPAATAAPAAAAPDAAAAEAASLWGLRFALGVAADVGMLPAIVAGAQLSVQGDYGPVGLRGYGALFASADTAADSGLGAGTFDLAAVGALLCGQKALGARFDAALCGGAEASYVAGTGEDVDASYTRSVWFAALRAEAALGFALLQGLGIWLRVGLAVPLSRPEFVLNGSEPIHQVAKLAGRGALELELTL
jgi:hypothetical protein